MLTFAGSVLLGVAVLLAPRYDLEFDPDVVAIVAALHVYLEGAFFAYQRVTYMVGRLAIEGPNSFNTSEAWGAEQPSPSLIRAQMSMTPAWLGVAKLASSVLTGPIAAAMYLAYGWWFLAYLFSSYGMLWLVRFAVPVRPLFAACRAELRRLGTPEAAGLLKLLEAVPHNASFENWIHRAMVREEPGSRPQSLDDVLRQAVKYREDQLAIAYLIPVEVDPEKRWVSYPTCKFCAQETSKTGNVSNMILLNIKDPRAFDASFGMACSQHAMELTARIAPEFSGNTSRLQSLIALALSEMRKQSEIFSADRPMFETNSPNLLRHRQERRAAVLEKYKPTPQEPPGE